MRITENNTGLKSRKEIAAELNISTKTLARYIKKFEMNLPSNRLLTPKEYEPVYARLS